MQAARAEKFARSPLSIFAFPVFAHIDFELDPSVFRFLRCACRGQFAQHILFELPVVFDGTACLSFQAD